MRKLTLALAIAALLALAPQVQADTVYYVGLATLADPDYTNGNTWNTMEPYSTDAVDLVATDDSTAGIVAQMTAPFGGHSVISGYDPALLSGDAVQFSPASISYAYASSGTPTLALTGLDANTSYTFTFYCNANRTGDRTIVMTVDGETSESGSLNPAGNTSEVYTTGALMANNGQIDVTFSFGDTNKSGYIYATAMKIEAAPVPEPASMSLLGLGGLAAVIRRRRK